MLILSDRTPFSSGGNRLCFRHPKQAERCLKVLRTDRTSEIRRSEKSFPSNLRPLSYFDENLTEFEVLQHLHMHYPAEIRQHIPKTYGITQTDFGPAHETSLIIDNDGKVSQTLEQYVWEFGLNQIAKNAIDRFKSDWRIQPPNTRDLIPHNMVLQKLNENHTIILIDGLGRKPRFGRKGIASSKRCQRRFDDLDARIHRLLKRKVSNTGPTERLNNLIRD